MRKLGVLLLVLMAVSLTFTACQRESGLVEPQALSYQGLSAAYQLPAGAVLQSATLSLYVLVPTYGSLSSVNVHRITAPWDEMTVTWNNFGSSYDPTVVSTFLPSATGWRTVDVTTLVQGWLDGSYPNYGLSLEQTGLEFSSYASSENATASFWPKLEICYLSSGGIVCETIQRGLMGSVSDAFVWQTRPDENWGGYDALFIQSVTGLNKIALLRFDIAPTPEPASLGDTVWYDTDEDGIQDAGEVGVPGVTVYLMDCEGNVLASTVTDANGFYLFSNLAAGDYNVHFVPELGYVFSPQNQGADDAVDSDADPATGLTVCTTLEAGENDMTWDAGIYVPPPPEGCSLTIGYWKTHAGFGPQPDYLSQFLPIWLGTAAGSHSMNVNTVQIAYDILVMKTYGEPSNGITKLYAQLLGAKLNIANGADGSAVAATISAADAWLADHDWTEWTGLSRTMKNRILGWKSTIDDYNNGLIGPGHCDIVGDGNDE